MSIKSGNKLVLLGDDTSRNCDIKTRGVCEYCQINLKQTAWRRKVMKSKNVDMPNEETKKNPKVKKNYKNRINSIWNTDVFYCNFGCGLCV